MKQCHLFFLTVALTTMVGSQAFGGSEQIIKQRAKDLRDQNNAQQGVPPPAKAPPPASGSTPPAQAAPVHPLTPQQQAMSQLVKSLTAIRPESKLTPELKSQLTSSLIGVAQGTPKPSSQVAARLSEDLAAALSQKLLTNVTRNRLAQNLNAILNPVNMQASQVADIVTDIQTLLESSGIPAYDAKKAAGSAREVASEFHKPAAK